MQIKNILVTAIAPFLALSMQFTPSASAQSLSNCNVEIIGRSRGSQVNLRDGAGTEYKRIAYVLVGQYINMLNDPSGSRYRRRDSEGMTWYYVEYEPSGTRGWIREEYISPQCS
jgi:hypothetical protein